MDQNYWQITTTEQRIKVKEYRIERLRKHISEIEAKIQLYQSELNALYREKDRQDIRAEYQSTGQASVSNDPH